MPTSVVVRAYIGLGANLGDPAHAFRMAAQELALLPDTHVVAVSRLWASAPVDAEGPDFLNAVVGIDTALDVHALLDGLQAIEQRLGRERSYRNAPRLLDLDLLLYGDQVLASKALTVPHPRMHLRRFVLGPLAELDSELVIPGLGAISDLLQATATQDAHPLAPSTKK